MTTIKTHKYSFPVKKRICTAQWQVDRIAARMIKERENRGYSLKMNLKKI